MNITLTKSFFLDKLFVAAALMMVAAWANPANAGVTCSTGGTTIGPPSSGHLLKFFVDFDTKTCSQGVNPPVGANGILYYLYSSQTSGNPDVLKARAVSYMCGVQTPRDHRGYLLSPFSGAPNHLPNGETYFGSIPGIATGATSSTLTISFTVNNNNNTSDPITYLFTVNGLIKDSTQYEFAYGVVTIEGGQFDDPSLPGPVCNIDAQACAVKFNDLNGDGEWDGNEPLLANWTFEITPTPLASPATLTTNQEGVACFDVSVQGDYLVTEVPQNGWIPTTPTTQTVHISGSEMAVMYFGNRLSDHFLSYDVKRAKGTPKFEKREVLLRDQFLEGIFRVEKPEELLNPADKNGEGISDPDTHLLSYKVKELGDLGDFELAGILVENQFGSFIVDVEEPDRLLVPASKSLSVLLPPPNPGTHNVDHFLCYKIEEPDNNDSHDDSDDQHDAPAIQVLVQDQFSNEPRLFDVKQPKRLCNPVDKNGEGIKNPDNHLLCYKVKPAKGERKHKKIKGIFVNDQLGPHRVDTKKEKELCVPSTKTLPPLG